MFHWNELIRIYVYMWVCDQHAKYLKYGIRSVCTVQAYILYRHYTVIVITFSENYLICVCMCVCVGKKMKNHYKYSAVYKFGYSQSDHTFGRKDRKKYTSYR